MLDELELELEDEFELELDELFEDEFDDEFELEFDDELDELLPVRITDVPSLVASERFS